MFEKNREKGPSPKLLLKGQLKSVTIRMWIVNKNKFFYFFYDFLIKSCILCKSVGLWKMLCILDSW